MEEFKTYTLTELCKGKGCYGIAASAVPFSYDKYTYLRITDINDDGTLNRVGLMSVDDDKASKYILKKNDIVFARTGNSTGRAYFYDGSDGILVYVGFLIKFSIDESKVNPLILKYFTHSKPYYDWVKSFDTGGTRGNINAKTFGNMPITLPVSRDIQNSIAAVLSSLDAKIELNRRINDNLEQQAQALFRSWFVDFEPWGGVMPEDWERTSMGEITEHCTQKVKNRTDVRVLSPVSSGELVLSDEFFTKQVYSKELSKYIVVEPNAFAYNPARINIGSIGINAFSFNGCVSPVYVVFKVHNGYEQYINSFIKTKLFKEEVALRAIGGVRQTLSYDDFSMIEVVKPSVQIAEQFATHIGKLHAVMSKNDKQSKELASLRDTLLPKLMSGEIKIRKTNR